MTDLALQTNWYHLTPEAFADTATVREQSKKIITIDLPQPRGPTTRMELLSPTRTVLDTRSCSWLFQ